MTAFSALLDAPVPSSFLWPFTDLSPTWSCFSHTREPKTGSKTPGASHQVLNRENYISLHLQEKLLLMNLKSLLAFLTTRVPFWLFVTLLFSSTPCPLLSNLLSREMFPWILLGLCCPHHNDPIYRFLSELYLKIQC